MRRPRIVFDRISLLVPLMLVLEGKFSYTASLLLAAVLHECGHLLAAHLMNIPIRSLRVSMLGAQLTLEDSLLSYEREWILCAAGPLFSLLGAGGGGLLAALCRSERNSNFAMISLALALVNLLPVGWLDGGRMFRAACRRYLSPKIADRSLRAVSFLFFLLLWMTSVYLLLRAGNSLSLFTFSLSLFVRFFLSDNP